MSSSSDRPTKRRRTTRGPVPDGSDLSPSTAEGEEESDLLNSQESDQEDEAESDDYATKPSSKTARILTNCKPQETNFVTQIDQPASSPSALRGARWRKRTASPASPAPPKPNLGQAKAPAPSFAAPQSNGVVEFNDDVDDDDLALAAAMSMSDDSEFESNSKLSGPPMPPKRNTGPLRQTTLFGTQAQNQSVESQTKTHNWPLMSRSEPPTHHKLDYSACGTWVYPTNLGTIRDYQYNIVQKGLFHNLLVALPTGLGKTFIAATIMLNWYQWTEDAQIMFVAPTKPLVSQQVNACFGIAGIPRSRTVLMTGETRPPLRAQEYLTKRVFFMTPQTLIRDLQTGICDPKRIVLLVVDEAHKGKGNYAYAEIVRFLNRFTMSFRVLALTATPGSTVESVQDVIDALNISRIEIRTEESLDIRQYVHSRNVDVQLLDESEEVSMSLELFASSLQPTLDQLVSLGNAYWSRDPKTLTAFGLTKARQTWMASNAARQGNFALKGKANAIFSILASLAHSIELLKYHGIGSFYRNLRDFQVSTTDGSNNGKYARAIANHESFVKLMNRLTGWVSKPDFVGHPKLSFVKEVALNHFMDANEGRSEANPSDTRIMIFAQYRDSAEEIARTLKSHEPLIRPHVFVGQSASKTSEAMDQRRQGEVIDKFKKGTYNTLIATSIGEEGLDIGEVDLIVCYDSSSSPIRMLQRMGRTGRKRAGKIVLLLMKGKEEDSYVKAKDNYEKMQKIIAGGTRFTFTEDRSPRIIPKAIDPVVDKKVVEIPIENSQDVSVVPKKRGRVPKMPPKKFHMPDGVETGFVQASILNGKTPRAAPVSKLDLEVASLPSLKSTLLTETEGAELDNHYRTVGGLSSQFVCRPRFGAFPVDQRTLRPTSKVGHSRVTTNMVALLDTIQRPIDNSPISSPQATPRAPSRDAGTEQPTLPSPDTSMTATQEEPSQAQFDLQSSNVMSSLASLSTMIRGKAVASTADLDEDLSEMENWAPSGSLPERAKKIPAPQRRLARVIDDSDDE